MTSAATHPPFYILISHSSLSTSNPEPASNTLAHPTIHYQYADDSPLVLLPEHSDEHVLVLDHDPLGTALPTVQSISKDLAVISLRLEDAPGAAAADEKDIKNDKMYIIETTACNNVEDTLTNDRHTGLAVLAQFKRRNALLRRALLHPNILEPSNASSQPGSMVVTPLRSDI